MSTPGAFSGMAPPVATAVQVPAGYAAVRQPPRTVAVALPAQALRGAHAPVEMPPPSPQALVTPSNVATTSWRTRTCPFAPAPRRVRLHDDGLGHHSDLSATSGVHTPANAWPTPTSATTPVERMLLLGPPYVGRAVSGSVGDGTPMSLSGTPTCTPSNAATTAWRTTVCPHAPLRRPAGPRADSLRSASSTPTSMSTSDRVPLPAANLWPRTPTVGEGATPKSYVGTPMSGVSGTLHAPEPQRILMRSFSVGSLNLPSDSEGPSPGNTPMNTGFIATPSSEGLMRVVSPFCIDVTPIAEATAKEERPSSGSGSPAGGAADSEEEGEAGGAAKVEPAPKPLANWARLGA